ncbi:putative deoxyribonuclease TATDN1-like protein [Baffinella frigidus]|nr:putative deoxyribonuclease TATDN1-like protein [Cryptophyta sp. CCMP2293]
MAAMPEGPECQKMRLIDTCVNLGDTMFQGVYHGKERHAPDFELVLKRAEEAGVERFIGVSGSLQDSKESIGVAERYPNIFATVGVHPTRCNEFEEDGRDPDAHLEALCAVAQAGGARVVAIGEIGLDYDREQVSDVQQIPIFALSLGLAKKLQLPVVFHNRNTSGDFERIVRENRDSFSTGIVHSFTGTVEEMRGLVEMGLYIGINGCGLRSEELLEMVGQIPADRLVVETDAPWCSIKNAHPSSKHVRTMFEEVKKPDKFVEGKMVKDRNEPAQVVQVVEVIAAMRGVEASEVADQTFRNTLRVLFPNETAE